MGKTKFEQENFIDITNDGNSKNKKIIKYREEQKEKLVKNMYKLGLNKIYIYEKLFDTITLITVDDIQNWDLHFSLKTRDTKDYVNYMAKGIYLSKEQTEYIINNLKNNNIEYLKEDYPVIKL